MREDTKSNDLIVVGHLLNLLRQILGLKDKIDKQREQAKERVREKEREREGKNVGMGEGGSKKKVKKEKR